MHVSIQHGPVCDPCRYTHTEVLAGDNAYSCEACARKVRAERRLCFEVAPNVLQICLKRFLSVRHLPQAAVEPPCDNSSFSASLRCSRE